MGISEQVDHAILETPDHEIRNRVHELEQEWSESRRLAAYAGSGGLLSLALARSLSPKFLMLPAFLGNSALLQLFPRLGGRPRSQIDRERYGLEQRLHPRDPLALINSGRRHGNRYDRVRQRTDPVVNQRIDDAIRGTVERMQGAPPAQIRARLDQLDREWDVDQVLQAQTAALANLGFWFARRDRRGYLLAGLGFVSLLSHAVSGWSPPLPLLRRLGVRTRREIDREKFALLSLL
ncbi:hypothetical protein JST97_22220 [bacterium]|nr:hypothetical protein [bacterium]